MKKIVDKLNADGSNPKYFLPAGEPIVNAFRAAKGDIRREGESIKSIIWLPDDLEDKGFIEKVHHDTCRCFERILIQAKRILGVCEIKGALFERLSELSDEDKIEIDMFMILNKELLVKDMKIMIWLVEEKTSPANIRAAAGIIGKIQHAIENTQKVVDSARDDG